MRRLAHGGCWLLGSLLAAQAFVFEPVLGSKARHWDLVTPETHVGAGARIPVSTNVVNPSTRAVRYFIGGTTYSSANRTAELNAVRAAFAQWQACPGAALKFEEGGVIPGAVDVNELDGTNVVYWARNSTLVAGGAADISGTLGLTFFKALDDVLVGADVVLNGVQFRWYTDLEYTPSDYREVFAESVLVHELGHFIGLEHSPLGGTTMFYGSVPGVGTHLGLSGDDLAGAQYLYPASGFQASRGRIQGKVTKAGSGVFGAVVVAEEVTGAFLTATLSLSGGTYDLPGLPPGTYGVRVTPLDPASASTYLTRGYEIVYNVTYGSADTSFLPATNGTVQVGANTTQTLNLSVSAGTPPLRVVRLLSPSTRSSPQSMVDAGVLLRPGQSNLVVGVYGPVGSFNGASLGIVGGGLTLEPLSVASDFFSFDLLAARLSIPAGATSGLRSLVVTRGSDRAFANGYFKIAPPVMDYNFDGLDDAFQRRYFPLFTAPEAGPAADPDGDSFNNLFEYRAGSSPVSAASLPSVRLDSVSVAAAGTTVIWQSFPGGRYQVFTRDALGPSSPWRAISPVLSVSGTTAQFLDTSATRRLGFYRVVLTP